MRAIKRDLQVDFGPSFREEGLQDRPVSGSYRLARLTQRLTGWPEPFKPVGRTVGEIVAVVSGTDHRDGCGRADLGRHLRKKALWVLGLCDRRAAGCARISTGMVRFYELMRDVRRNQLEAGDAANLASVDDKTLDSSPLQDRPRDHPTGCDALHPVSLFLPSAISKTETTISSTAPPPLLSGAAFSLHAAPAGVGRRPVRIRLTALEPPLSPCGSAYSCLQLSRWTSKINLARDLSVSSPSDYH